MMIENGIEKNAKVKKFEASKEPEKSKADYLGSIAIFLSLCIL